MRITGLVLAIDERKYTKANGEEVTGADVVIADRTTRETVHVEYTRAADVPGSIRVDGEADIECSGHSYVKAIQRCKFRPATVGASA